MTRSPRVDEVAALRLLAQGPQAASMVGAHLRSTGVWRTKNSRGGVSSNGGGDYPAQMLLGRMRRAGWCRTQHTKGSSVWELTNEGARVIPQPPIHKLACPQRRNPHGTCTCRTTPAKPPRSRARLPVTRAAVRYGVCPTCLRTVRLRNVHGRGAGCVEPTISTHRMTVAGLPELASREPRALPRHR